ncbi:hypothetical protein ACS96_31285 [Pseudomonas aeruginosa]|nr:hypothetical protein ACS96_31235 [Pseudomonas aeruginosa]KMQ53148.1 hypothetical protein ACS96_31285 [Pseudomonas aeruginosa]
MLAVADRQVVIGLQLDLALSVHGVMLLGLELAVAVRLHGVVAFVADADLLVVLDVLVPVALGMDEDLFLALAILDAQLVVAAAARAAEALEDAAGLVRRQLVGHRVGGVVDAAADQRLVGIAFEEVHQHFHADPRNDDAAIAVAGPTAGYA